MDFWFNFSTVIGVKNNFLPQEKNQMVIDKCYELQNLMPLSTHNGWLSQEDSPYNTLKTYNLIFDPSLDFLFDAVNKEVNNFAEYHSDNGKYSCMNAWINIYKGGNFQEPHVHHFPCMYSAVFFPKVPLNSGKIVFGSPFVPVVNESDVFNEENPLNWANRWILPEENSLVVFKSSLSHFVLPGHNEDDRISIPFNYILDPEYYYKKYKFVKKENKDIF
jgi:uncharacterized protein (TIGR02466 family)